MIRLLVVAAACLVLCGCAGEGEEEGEGVGRLAYVRNEGGDTDIYVRGQGGEAVNVTRTPEDDYDVHAVRADGSCETQLTDEPVWELTPAWTGGTDAISCGEG